MDRALRLEVKELTEMLRDDGSFAVIRAMLEQHGIITNTALMPGLIENAEWYEIGAVVPPDGRVFVFEQRLAATDV